MDAVAGATSRFAAFQSTYAVIDGKITMYSMATQPAPSNGHCSPFIARNGVNSMTATATCKLLWT